MIDALGAPPLRHPQANRERLLGGQRVGYRFERAQRKTLGLRVCPQGLTVRAPARLALAEVERFLDSKARWILGKLQQVQARPSPDAPPTPEQLAARWRAGASVPYLGQPLALLLEPAAGLAPGSARLSEAGLHLALPLGSAPERVRSAVYGWLQRSAYSLYVQRLQHFAPQLGVQWRSLKLSNAGTRWGSAKADGSLRLHWRLIQLEPHLIDYVVVHELAHLREMNHSPAFWQLVQGVLPDQIERRRALKQVQLPSD
ncbi:M48 family metallopeptidase [Serpentinimonas barnesii]|uniref:M48 family metallopeptidase n=1 Tax=Serpentinimonas barnesii TaxID=1458427 RepID=UPI0005EE0211|nr:SprT family zinc-dependent metalloprotease [Serpentinimonas barnesii]